MRILLIIIIAFAMPAMAMNKAELINAIASESGLSKADAKRALEALGKQTGKNLRKEHVAYMPELGIFLIGRGNAGNCSLASRSKRRCILFYPEQPGEAGIVSTYLENYFSDAMNYHAELQDNACDGGKGRVCPDSGRAAITVPSHQTMLTTYQTFDVERSFSEPFSLAEIGAFWAGNLATEMKFLNLNARASEVFVTEMLSSLEERALEAQDIRKEVQAQKASGAREELTNRIARKTGLGVKEIDLLYIVLAKTVHARLKKGDRVALVGFGSFTVSRRAARTGRNPQTGATITVSAKSVVKFKAGADLSKKVN
jgi:DNA-binding protein HU-beta